MSTPTTASGHSGRRRRLPSSYSRLEAEKKSEKRTKYVTICIMGAIVLVLLASLGVIAFNLAS